MAIQRVSPPKPPDFWRGRSVMLLRKASQFGGLCSTGRSSQMGFFKEVGKNMRIFQSDTYKETIKSTERVAQGTYRLLAEKSPEEAGLIGSRATELSVKIQEI